MNSFHFVARATETDAEFDLIQTVRFTASERAVEMMTLALLAFRPEVRKEGVSCARKRFPAAPFSTTPLKFLIPRTLRPPRIQLPSCMPTLRAIESP